MGGRREAWRLRNGEPESCIMGCEQSCLPFAPKGAAISTFQRCSLYKHPWKDNPEPRGQLQYLIHKTCRKVRNSWGIFSQQQPKSKSRHPMAPNLQKKVKFLKLILSTSANFIPYIPCLTTWARDTLSPSHNLWILLSRSLLRSALCLNFPLPSLEIIHLMPCEVPSKAQHSVCCWVNVCLWAHGASNPYSFLNLYLPLPFMEWSQSPFQ